jgi:acyl-CoA reductase-like NAD-dependent aldehyde dehydrogenase
VYTQDIDRAFHTARSLAAAAVMVNDHSAFRVDWMPFAGHRTSGLSVGGIAYTMDEMTQDKLLVIKT